MSSMFATSEGVVFDPHFEAPIMHTLYSEVAGMINSGMTLLEVQECAKSTIISLDPAYPGYGQLVIEPHIYHYKDKNDLAGDVLVFEHNDASNRRFVLNKRDEGFTLITFDEFIAINGIDVNTNLFNYINEL